MDQLWGSLQYAGSKHALLDRMKQVRQLLGATHAAPFASVLCRLTACALHSSSQRLQKGVIPHESSLLGGTVQGDMGGSGSIDLCG